MGTGIEYGPQLPPQFAQAINDPSFGQGAINGALILGLLLFIGALILWLFKNF